MQVRFNNSRPVTIPASDFVWQLWKHIEPHAEELGLPSNWRTDYKPILDGRIQDVVWDRSPFDQGLQDTDQIHIIHRLAGAGCTI